MEFWQPSLGSETATSGALLLPFFGALEKGEGADGPAGPPWMNDRQIWKIGTPEPTGLSFFSRIFTTGIKTSICWKKKGAAHFSKKPTVLVAQPPRMEQKNQSVNGTDLPHPSPTQLQLA